LTKINYAGEYNLAKAERILIVLAHKKCKGVGWKMAKELDISLTDLKKKVKIHSLPLTLT
jgi:DNA-binding NtrC family response regulator